MQLLNLPTYDVLIETRNNINYIWDFIRKKFIRLTKEEWVRQHFLNFLVYHNGYPVSLIGVEKKIVANNMDKRFDILIFKSSGTPLIIVECKSHEIKITQQTFMQASNYNTVLKAPYLIVTNGLEHHCAKINFETKSSKFLDSIPTYSQLKNIE